MPDLSHLISSIWTCYAILAYAAVFGNLVELLLSSHYVVNAANRVCDVRGCTLHFSHGRQRHYSNLGLT